MSHNIQAFREGLSQLGYVEGRNILIEWRSADGKAERLPDLAAELVRLHVDVIVTHSTPAIRAVQRATATIPIVMANVGDPVSEGFVASYARPGGNITGFTNLSPDLGTKRLELLKEVSPKVLRAAVFTNPAQHKAAIKEIEAAGRLLRLQLLQLEVRIADHLDKAFEAMTRERADGLITLPNPLLWLDRRTRSRITEFASKRRIASIYESTEYVDSGGLISYGPDFAANFRSAAAYVDKILRGANPADLPVQQPTKFELVINLKTAKQIGLTIPPNVLARADRVIR
jgi:putative ABC transport system substrate-binding protein